VCNTCNASFLKQTRFLQTSNYCCKECASTAKQNRKEAKCAQCNTLIFRSCYKLTLSKSGLYFCNRECKDKAQRIGGIKEIQPSHYGESRKDYRSHCFKVHNLEKICTRCGFDNPLAICVHHKDRNRNNNNIDNLEVLCYNCHAIEHHPTMGL